MTCPEESVWRAWLDGEQSASGLEEHRASCNWCRASASRIQARQLLCHQLMGDADVRSFVLPQAALARWEEQYLHESMWQQVENWVGAGARQRTVGLFASLLAHVAMAAVLLSVGLSPAVQQFVSFKATPLFFPASLPSKSVLKPAADRHGGGGGGLGSRTQDAQGRLPRELKQFVPPQQIQPERRAMLTIDPGLELPEELRLPQPDVTQLGNPLARMGALSNGAGREGGIGSGIGGGIGPGSGKGYGPGSGGDGGGGVFRPGGGVSLPVPLSRKDPEYSEEARKARYQGSVLLSIIVDITGRVSHIEVVRPLGMGLDEKAIEAVRAWRFRPGTKNGQPVAVMANFEVNFRLL